MYAAQVMLSAAVNTVKPRISDCASDTPQAPQRMRIDVLRLSASHPAQIPVAVVAPVKLGHASKARDCCLPLRREIELPAALNKRPQGCRTSSHLGVEALQEVHQRVDAALAPHAALDRHVLMRQVRDGVRGPPRHAGAGARRTPPCAGVTADLGQARDPRTCAVIMCSLMTSAAGSPAVRVARRRQASMTRRAHPHLLNKRVLVLINNAPLCTRYPCRVQHRGHGSIGARHSGLEGASPGTCRLSRLTRPRSAPLSAISCWCSGRMAMSPTMKQASFSTSSPPCSLCTIG